MSALLKVFNFQRYLMQQLALEQLIITSPNKLFKCFQVQYSKSRISSEHNLHVLFSMIDSSVMFGGQEGMMWFEWLRWVVGV